MMSYETQGATLADLQAAAEASTDETPDDRPGEDDCCGGYDNGSGIECDDECRCWSCVEQREPAVRAILIEIQRDGYVTQ